MRMGSPGEVFTACARPFEGGRGPGQPLGTNSTDSSFPKSVCIVTWRSPLHGGQGTALTIRRIRCGSWCSRGVHHTCVPITFHSEHDNIGKVEIHSQSPYEVGNISSSQGRRRFPGVEPGRQQGARFTPSKTQVLPVACQAPPAPALPGSLPRPPHELSLPLREIRDSSLAVPEPSIPAPNSSVYFWSRSGYYCEAHCSGIQWAPSLHVSLQASPPP